MHFWKKLRMWRQRKRFEADLEEEIRIHREMSGGAAFGSVALFMEQSREVWGLARLESWKQDIRYALRGFRRTPAFVLGVIGAIGLGIGLNTTMFTVFNAYALRPYAVRDPYGLYSFEWSRKDGTASWFSWDQYQDVRRQKPGLMDALAFMNFGAQVEGRTVLAELVSDNYFSMLGVPMAQGRPLLPEDTSAMVLSHGFWRNGFGGDPEVLGRKVYVRGQPFEVVGITNAAFDGIEGYPTGFWIPLRMSSAVTEGEDLFGPKRPTRLRLVGRLQAGVSVPAAKSALLAWARSFAADAAGLYMEPRATAIPLTRDAILTFTPLITAFILVLLIACANVSNMMLARALARQREIAIRVSLGAGRMRLIRQLLTESVLLATPAALAGFAIAEATINGARRLMFATVPPAFARMLAIEDLSPDWRVFGFILAASVATALLFGLVPAIQTTRSRLVETNRGDFSSDYRPARLRNMLVVVQVAVCALLLVSTAVVLRSKGRMLARPLGLDPHGVWDVHVLSRYQRKVAERLASEPGVEAVAAAYREPLWQGTPGMEVVPGGSKQTVALFYNLVAPEYFGVFRIPVLRGRGFTAAETEAEAPVAVVGESAARRLWPGQDAIGQTVTIVQRGARPNPAFRRAPEFASARVIGVVGDVMTGWGANRLSIYFPTHAGIYGNDSLLVRCPAENARHRLETAINGIGPNLADFMNPMDDVLALQIYPFRVTSWLAGFLAGVALLLTVSGIYGVMAYLVSQRTKEIGIRVALGANAWSVVRMVVRQSAWLAGIGAAVGVGLALAVAPVFANQLEVIKPYDWAPYAATAVLVLAAAVVASWAPARRAVGIDPVQTLRCD